MARYRENDCVGCPQGCIHCGRDGYIVIVCDKCGQNDEQKIYRVQGKDMCLSCLLEEYQGDFIADMWGEICEKFGERWADKSFDECDGGVE